MSAPVIGWGQIDCHNLYDSLQAKTYSKVDYQLLCFYGRGYVVLSSVRVPADMGKAIEDMIVKWHANQTDSDGEPLYEDKVSASYTYGTLCPVEYDDMTDVWTMMAVHDDSFTEIVHVAGPAYGCGDRLNAKHLTLVPTGDTYTMDEGEEYGKPGAILVPDGGNVKYHTGTHAEVDYIDLHVGDILIHIDFDTVGSDEYMPTARKAVRISAMDETETGYRSKLLPIVSRDSTDDHVRHFEWEVIRFDYKNREPSYRDET